ncbi:MAG: hypothetical protein AAF624_03250 [Bacteroidota bacterium]
METLADEDGPIDHLFLDGGNDLYLPLLAMLEPRCVPGATIGTDNAALLSAKPLMDHLRAHPERSVTTRLTTDKGATEWTCYLGGGAN